MESLRQSSIILQVSQCQHMAIGIAVAASEPGVDERTGSHRSMVLGSCTLLGEGTFGGSFSLGSGSICATSGVAEEEGSWLVRTERGAEQYCASGGGDHCCDYCKW